MSDSRAWERGPMKETDSHELKKDKSPYQQIRWNRSEKSMEGRHVILQRR
jgi:hypothetical protein